MNGLSMSAHCLEQRFRLRLRVPALDCCLSFPTAVITWKSYPEQPRAVTFGHSVPPKGWICWHERAVCQPPSAQQSRSPYKSGV